MAKTLIEAANILQEMHRGIEGIESAPYLNEYPRGELNRMDLPMVLCYPGPANWRNPFGMGCTSEARTWNVIVITADPQQGIGFETLEESLKLIDVMGKNYNDSSNDVATLSDGDMLLVVNQDYPRDSGFDDEIILGDTVYYGFTFEILVWRKA